MNYNNITEVIINTINTIFYNIFSSIDNNIYSILDKITFIDSNILNNYHFKYIFGTSNMNGILLIANSLILGFLLYYCIKLILSYFSITYVERPYPFIFKLLFFSICMNCSFFICEQLLLLNSEICSAIRSLGETLFGVPISFSSLIERLNSIIYIEENNLNIFSIDGLLKSIISISFINLIFSYSIRYIMIKVFILISPFCILSLCLPNSSQFFKSWLKCLISLLLVQILVAIILLVIFSIDFSSNNIFSKFLLCGAIFCLIKANSYMKEFIGGISIELSSSISNMTSVFKGGM